MNALFLIAFSLNECTHFRETPIGTKEYKITNKDDETICIKPLYYPTYIIFSNFGDDTIYYENIDGENTDLSSLLRFLNFYQKIELINSTVMIKTPTGCDVSFTTISFPGTCSNGIYFSNRLTDEINLSQDETGFKKLQVFDDKCMVWATKGEIDISLEMESDDHEDQLYVYYNFTNFQSISGNSSLHLHTDWNRPLFFRLVADDENPPRWAKIKISSTGDPPRRPEFGFYIPDYVPPICDESKNWYSGAVAIAVVIILILLVLSSLVLIGKQCIFIDSEDDLLLSAAEAVSSNVNNNGIHSFESMGSED